MKDDPYILQIAIESLPGPDWTSVISGIFLPVIALAGTYIALQQFVINRQRLKHELYDRRMALYRAAHLFFTLIGSAGKIGTKEISEYVKAFGIAKFLFKDDVYEKLHNVYMKSVDFMVVCEKLYPEDGSAGLPVGEERDNVSAEKEELLGWFRNERDELDIIFKPYLSLDKS